jgi:hypothetical protein
MAKKKVARYVAYHTLAVDVMDELLFKPYKQKLGKEAFDRIHRQLRYYDYYDGKQHIHPDTGALVHGRDLPRPPGLAYDPTRYATNYFKAFITRKARWQMGGEHGVSAKAKQLDPVDKTNEPDYVPSPAQKAENERAQLLEKMIYTLWKDNRMREKLLEAARDRMIAGRVGIKIVFNPRSGKLQWVFRPDTEIIPVYSDDDHEEMIAVHFVTYEEQDGTEPDYVRKQTFELEDMRCYVSEATYDQDSNLVEVIQEKTYLGIDFLPVVLVPLTDIVGRDVTHGEVDDLIEMTDIINKLNEDAIDSLKFDMFPITAFINVPPGTSDEVDIAPGAMVEISGSGIQGTASPDIKKVESTFTYKEALEAQFVRVKSAMHEITNLPNIVPQELNFGGLNADALHVMFHSIIQDTEEHWIVWNARLQELHEKSLRYLQVIDAKGIKHKYDSDALRKIGDDYEHEMNFVLPLPDNRADLVKLLVEEVASGFESTKGAIERLGVEDVEGKMQQIQAEKLKAFKAFGDPYAEGGGTSDEDEQGENDEDTDTSQNGGTT